jgi:hypothetical protein
MRWTVVIRRLAGGRHEQTQMMSVPAVATAADHLCYNPGKRPTQSQAITIIKLLLSLTGQIRPGEPRWYLHDWCCGLIAEDRSITPPAAMTGKYFPQVTLCLGRG